MQLVPQLDSVAGYRYRRPLMLKWVRARASAVAQVLLLSLATFAWPHSGDAHHDADGEFALVVAHDAPGHSLRGPSSSEEQPRHCAICHAARSFRPLTQVTFLASSPVEAVGFISPDVVTAAKSDFAEQPPLRAPPTSPNLT